MNMNIGVLKHLIRQNIIPTDDAEQLKDYLPDLSQIHRNSLLSTTVEYDAVECFKLLYQKFYPMTIFNLAPPQICCYLKDDVNLRRELCIHKPGKKSLAKYFLLQDYYNFDHSTYFFDHENDEVVKGILDKLDNTVSKELLDHFFQIIGISFKDTTPPVQKGNVSVDPRIKMFTDKYDVIWKRLTHHQQLKVDPKRTYKEDWKQLISFPYDGFLNMHVYVLPEILRYAYSDNVWLKNKMAVFIVEKIVKSVRKIKTKNN